MSKLEYQRYEMERMVYWDNNAAFHTAITEGEAKGMEKGREKGLVEGMEIGRDERSTEIARNLKKEGLDLSLIAKTTGLSPEEIERLN